MEIALAVAAVAVFGALLFAYLTRPGKNAPPELKEATEAIMSRRCSCGSRLARDVADGGDLLIFTCVDPECGRKFMVDMTEEDDSEQD